MAAWGLPGLDRKLEITFSQRFRTSLGRFYPATREIRLAAFLLNGPEEILHETLCHEAAHAAVWEVHDRRTKPHGPEWRALVRAAGFHPRATLPASVLPASRGDQGPARLWEHRCPVCHATRVARRPVSRWRCAPCRGAGGKGALLITRIDASHPGDR